MAKAAAVRTTTPRASGATPPQTADPDARPLSSGFLVPTKNSARAPACGGIRLDGSSLGAELLIRVRALRTPGESMHAHPAISAPACLSVKENLSGFFLPPLSVQKYVLPLNALVWPGVPAVLLPSARHTPSQPPRLLDLVRQVARTRFGQEDPGECSAGQRLKRSRRVSVRQTLCKSVWSGGLVGARRVQLDDQLSRRLVGTRPGPIGRRCPAPPCQLLPASCAAGVAPARLPPVSSSAATPPNHKKHQQQDQWDSGSPEERPARTPDASIPPI